MLVITILLQLLPYLVDLYWRNFDLFPFDPNTPLFRFFLEAIINEFHWFGSLKIHINLLLTSIAIYKVSILVQWLIKFVEVKWEPIVPVVKYWVLGYFMQFIVASCYFLRIKTNIILYLINLVHSINFNSRFLLKNFLTLYLKYIIYICVCYIFILYLYISIF